MSQSMPSQTLHIFRKDSIHLWPEILISFGILGAFAWSDIVALQAQPGSGLDPATAISWILRFLTPIAWMVILSRLIHDEELVGDRQFWITRPYTWPSLLASKVLFCIVFILLPFGIMQAFLLHHAHLYPTLALSRMGHVLLIIAMVALLPLFSIAAVTLNFVRYMLAALGALLYAIAAFAIGFWQFPDHFSAPYVEYVIGGFFVLLPIAAIILAYARRNIFVARILLAATPIVFVIAAALAPVGPLVNSQYPDKSLGTLAFNSSVEGQQPDGRIFVFHKEVTLRLPVVPTLQGDADKFAARVGFVNATFTSPDGYHYTTGWQPSATASGLITGRPALLITTLPESVFNRIKGKQITMHLDVAAQGFQPGTPYNIVATEKPFPIPDHANCSVSPDDGSLNCNYAYQHEYGAELTATVHSGDCLRPGPQSAIAQGFLQPVSSSFDPVATSHSQLMLGGQQAIPLCANSPITITPTVPQGYGRFHVDIPAITIDNYALHLRVKDKDAPAPGPAIQQ